jgi:hypothetical protein
VGAELAEAREALVVLESRAGAGKVTAAERKKAEARLAAAERLYAEPWSERRRGAERGAADAHAEVARYAAEHLAEIAAEIEEDGRAAAEMVDATRLPRRGAGASRTGGSPVRPARPSVRGQRRPAPPALITS